MFYSALQLFERVTEENVTSLFLKSEITQIIIAECNGCIRKNTSKWSESQCRIILFWNEGSIGQYARL